MKDIKLVDVLKFTFKYILTLSTVVVLLGGCYWRLYVEPKVDQKIHPLIVGIFEIQTTLNKIISDSIRQKVRHEVESFEKLLQKK